MYNKMMGSLGDLKTEVEEAKWDNMRKSVGKPPSPQLFYGVPRLKFFQPRFRVSSSSSLWAWNSMPSLDQGSKMRPRKLNINRGSRLRAHHLPSPKTRSKLRMRETNSRTIQLEI